MSRARHIHLSGETQVRKKQTNKQNRCILGRMKNTETVVANDGYLDLKMDLIGNRS